MAQCPWEGVEKADEKQKLTPEPLAVTKDVDDDDDDEEKKRLTVTWRNGTENG